ncbi:MAG: iron-containing alcohol dehydrogenase, partial [Bacteroidales bacterium]
LHNHTFDCIVSIGGGSIIDLGKALSAMLTVNDSIENYLEGLPTYRPHPGTKIPFVAVPTTAGTGSETTKNAVISKYGEHGYKRSLRHNNFIPNVAIIDPELQITCPAQTTANSGMDALTQLIESYFSPQANLFTDILAEKGIELAAQSLLQVYSDPSHIESRTKMAMAAYLSGITLAHAGLGAVHGFASSIGGLYNVPHGAICACLLTKTLEINLQKMIALSNSTQHQKILRLSQILQPENTSLSINHAAKNIIATLYSWSKILKIPSLKTLGIEQKDMDKIANLTQIKNNPVPLDAKELKLILLESW